MGTKQPSVVYLVEDHADLETHPITRYWATVYLSESRAKTGVEHYAGRGGHGPVRWEDRGAVLYAYPASGTRQKELYRVVPLSVRPDDQPDP